MTPTVCDPSLFCCPEWSQNITFSTSSYDLLHCTSGKKDYNGVMLKHAGAPDTC